MSKQDIDVKIVCFYYNKITDEAKKIKNNLFENIFISETKAGYFVLINLSRRNWVIASRFSTRTEKGSYFGVSLELENESNDLFTYEISVKLPKDGEKFTDFYVKEKDQLYFYFIKNELLIDKQRVFDKELEIEENE